jgi:hypothetical protein
MVNTRMFEFKHPKYYKELRKLRNNSDRAISKESSTEENQRAPDPGQSTKPQAPSSKRQATSSKPQASSAKSIKPQATSFKPQA